MVLAALYALAIFVAFALLGGLAVLWIIRHQTEPSEGDPPPGGFPMGDVDN